jgi:hypothetical protein
MSLLALLLSASAHATIPAAYGVIEHHFTFSVPAGVAPALTLTAPKADVVFVVECAAGDQKLEWETGVVPQGEERIFVLGFEGASTTTGRKDDRVRSAECGLFARMANGLSERKMLQVAWTVREAEPATPDTKQEDDAAAAPTGSIVTPKGQEPPDER